MLSVENNAKKYREKLPRIVQEMKEVFERCGSTVLFDCRPVSMPRGCMQPPMESGFEPILKAIPKIQMRGAGGLLPAGGQIARPD